MMINSQLLLIVAVVLPEYITGRKYYELNSATSLRWVRIKLVYFFSFKSTDDWSSSYRLACARPGVTPLIC